MSENGEPNYRNVLSDYLGTEPSNLKFQKQVHGVNIIQVGRDYSFDTADGLITNEKGLYLCARTADCAAILIYDPVHEAVGALHSGWRGTLQNIAKAGIEKMNHAYNSKPEDILAYISPCASVENYEVDYDVAGYFPDSVIPLGNGKYLYDNKKQIFLQLIQAGLKPANIEISDVCTIADKNFHSYRRDGKAAGRMAAYIAIKQTANN
jgi:YfiH family protein